MPEVVRCFGTFPPKYATYLIAIFGLASGGTGLAGIILYGLIENALLVYITGRNDITLDDAVKKAILLSIGLTSLLLTVASALLFAGATSGSPGSLAAGVWVLFGMCMILICAAIAAPVSCFFLKSACIIKKVSVSVMVLGATVVTVFLEIWLYFMVVANAYMLQL